MVFLLGIGGLNFPFGSLSSSAARRSGVPAGASIDLVAGLEDPLVASRDGVIGGPSAVDFSAIAPVGVPTSGFMLGIVLDLVIARRAWGRLFVDAAAIFSNYNDNAPAGRLLRSWHRWH